MKKIILASMLIGLVGCTSDPFITELTKAHTHISSFDGTKEIYSQPMYVFATSGFHAAPFSIGARWTNEMQDYIILEVQVRGSYVDLSSLYLNIDGKIQQYHGLAPTKLISPDSQTLAPRLSKRGFMVPINDVIKFKTAQFVKIKVITTSDGYFEGDVIKSNKVSPGAKSVLNVVDQIK